MARGPRWPLRAGAAPPARALRWRHWLLLLGLLALAIRLPIALHAPPFVDLDTRQYLKPAFDLLQGEELGLTLRRTPGYPLFLAAALWLFGADFGGILLLQHA
jgi:hypothetical protein